MLVMLAIYLLRIDRVAGLMVDDAWYVLLAKALAEGQGYRIISSAVAQILPGYPPGFPGILSLVFRVNPRFPENVWLLKSVSIAAMMGVAALSYAYCRRYRRLPRELAASIAIAVTISPAFVFLATSTVMTECVFTLTQLGAIALIHRCVESPDERRSRVSAILAGSLAAVTLLIRSSGIALIAAAMLWFLKERLVKRAVLFAVVVMVCLLPWLIYARAHTPTYEERAAHRGSIAWAYGDQFWMRWAGAPASGQITLADLPARVKNNLVDVFGRDVGGIILPVAFRGPSESGQEVVALGGMVGLMAASMGGAWPTMVISFLLSGIALVGFVQALRERVTVAELLVPISLAIIAVWPYWSFRFVLPLAPYLFLYFVKGMQTVVPLEPLRVARIAMAVVIGLSIFDNAQYILLARDPARLNSLSWIADAEEVEAALEWMNTHLENEGVIASTNPALVYLRTGRTAVAFDDPPNDWKSWRRRGVRYVACLFPLELPASSNGEYKVLYRSPGRLWIIEI